jgi:hypothetical protein
MILLFQYDVDLPKKIVLKQNKMPLLQSKIQNDVIGMALII